MKPLEQVESWLKTWETSVEDRRVLYQVVIQILSNAEKQEAAHLYRMKCLKTFEGASSETLAETVAMAESVVAHVSLWWRPSSAVRKTAVDNCVFACHAGTCDALLF